MNPLYVQPLLLLQVLAPTLTDPAQSCSSTATAEKLQLLHAISDATATATAAESDTIDTTANANSIDAAASATAII
jgi:hypothetical protein